ncbi:MAG: hypothetical protein OI74_04285 [Gammaproteobacteria bacterium (ex Lamellibrachia satsuma)]|nr:MAG: hypothetical protein HPY30_14925 [Gammaproteobacteria bacterium (ex Lamellibrachia satsuma)]RRS34824.1 MAG: hypothetical protein OI74_04285 [Gammaproteobacteria bacterium (ex Lamellibrachia satsuma)]RRS35797.1 MAG: hypothetical protein NV67_09555 [Gammaproteobacteria bacterium (ex Lamellibrachia satsuma)]
MAAFGRSGRILSAVALGLLLLGGLVYLACRNSSSVYFLAGIFPEAIGYSMPAAAVCSSVPSFIHIYAFILLTAVVLNPSRAGLALICLCWIAIELFFEFGQHPFFAQYLTEKIPAWFENFPFLEVADTYFLTGTFDPLDVLFILFGTAAALLTLHKVQRWEVDHA